MGFLDRTIRRAALAPLVALSMPAVEAPECDEILRVMTLNLWHEGTNVDGGFEKIVAVLESTRPDVVVLTEVRNQNGVDFLDRVLGALGDSSRLDHGKYVAGDVGVLSRFPVLSAGPLPVDDESGEASRSDVVLYELDRDGTSLWVASAHLDYLNYALFLPRGYDANTFRLIDDDGDGKPDPVTDLETLHEIDLASSRDEAIDRVTSWAEDHPKADLILAGDFNEASHLDWGERMRKRQDHNDVVIEWHNSVQLAEAGFVDGYRAVHKNPTTHPGSTWPAPAEGVETTAWAPLADERDRIDFVYARSSRLVPVKASVVGPEQIYVRGELVKPRCKDTALASDLPWPSDHRGVLIEFEVTGARRDR